MSDTKRKTVIFIANRKAAREIARHKAILIGVRHMNTVDNKQSKQRHNRYGTKAGGPKAHKQVSNRPMSWFGQNWREMATKDTERYYRLNRA